MSVSISLLRWSNNRIDNLLPHSNKAIVNCLVFNIIESKYEFRAITLLGICIGRIVAKTNILDCASWNQCSNMHLGISIRCWIQCSNILARFSVLGFMPICTRALYCLRKQYFLILLTKQHAYLYRISCGIFLKLLLYFRKYFLLFWTILKMFRHFRTFHIC